MRPASLSPRAGLGLIAFGLAASLALAPAPPAVAQSSAVAAGDPAPGRLAHGARFGAWTVACEAIAVGETACVLSQRLVRTADNALLTDLLLFWDGTLEQAWLAARVPTGVYFPDGFTLFVEGAEDGTELAWQSCSPQICEAALPIDMETLQRLEDAEALRALYRPAITAEPLAFRLSLEGGTAGLEALAEALSR